MNGHQRRLMIAIMGTAVLVTSAQAQTPPRPSFSIARHPALYYNVWPGDFNRDGRADLIAGLLGDGTGTQAASDLVIAIGRGDGTFEPPRSLRLAAKPLNVGDFNGDGFLDVLVARFTSLGLLPGNGNGTFQAARLVGVVDDLVNDPRGWALAVDFNGDGARDIAVADHAGGLHIYPGNGDFTFGPRATLTLPADGSDGISRDFNGDGRRDIAVVGVGAGVATVLINQGGLTFTRSDLVLNGNGDPSDVTAGDLNQDGKLDLIVASSSAFIGFYDRYASAGGVSVLIGNGDGTFLNAVQYDTGVGGEVSVVVGDFNRDGRLDVATGNQSLHDDDDFVPQLWDSISIMAGDGTGRLQPGATYSLGSVNPLFGAVDPDYPGGHHQLNTADLDGDHQTDLIASPGAILLNRAPAPNTRPTVFAGPDHFVTDSDTYIFRGEASDPDMDWLTYTWTDDSGSTIGTVPWIFRHVGPEGTTRTYTLTVDDGRGGRASDSMTIRVRDDDDPLIGLHGLFGASVPVGVPFTVTWVEEPAVNRYSLSYSTDGGRTFTPVPGCSDLPPDAFACTWSNPGPVTDRARLRLVAPDEGGDWIDVSDEFRIVAGSPLAGWVSKDIGAVGAPGRAAYANGTWTVEGSGADIWNSADEFHYVYRRLSGSFVMTAHVASVEDLHLWVKSGLMVREDLTPGSRHAALFATPGTERGIAFQRRLFLNAESRHSPGPLLAPPVWLKVTRAGNTVSAYCRQNQTDTWTLVGRQTFSALHESVYVGLAVSSHIDGALATAMFDNVEVTTLPGSLFNSSGDIGDVGVRGNIAFDGVFYDVEGSGTDIWGTSDAFYFAYAGSPQRQITARVRGIEHTHVWAKAGVMFRQSIEPTAKHVMVVLTPGRGIAMQYRSSAGGQSAQVASVASVAPKWVRLARVGNTYTGSASEDGVTWYTLGSVTIDMNGLAGLAVTSHDDSTLATATFEDVTVVPF